MSYNTDLKSAITKNIPDDYDECFSLLYAMVRCAFSLQIKGRGSIALVYETNQSASASFAFKLIKNLFSYSPTLQKVEKDAFGKSTFYRLSVDDSQVAMQMLHSFNMMSQSGMEMQNAFIDESLLPTEEAKTAFVRGALIACGYVYDPAKSYCIELHFNSERDAADFRDYLLEFDINSRIRPLKNAIILYIKRLEDITNLLTLSSAYNFTLDYESRSAIHQMKSSIRRRVNFDTANMNRAVEASFHQVAAIERIISTVGIRALSDPLAEAALLRLDNPGISVSDLSEISGINQSTLDKRLRKIMQIAKEIK